MKSARQRGQAEALQRNYDRALLLIQYYVQLTWLVFGAFILAETVLVAAVAAVAKDGPPWLQFAISMLGLLITLPWWASFRYNHALYLLRVDEAREMEPRAATFFTAGADLIGGKPRMTSFGKVAIPAFALVLAPRRSVQLLIALFAFSFAALAWHYWSVVAPVPDPSLDAVANGTAASQPGGQVNHPPRSQASVPSSAPKFQR